MNWQISKSRAQVLVIGGEVLRSRMPTWNARFTVEGFAFRARFAWPGVVTVADENTGVTVGRSMPGEPWNADAETREADRRDPRP
jgi:hypothetical protein